jgi:hypothetical protein
MDSKEEQGVAFYAKINAHDTLIRLLVFEAQRRDPQFAERCRLCSRDHSKDTDDHQGNS